MATEICKFGPLMFNLLLHLGLSSAVSDFSDRIVEGRDAFIEEFPHQVSLQLLGQHACGGSIIADTVIITAAHCVELVKNITEVPNPMISIRVGATHVPTDGEVFEVKSISQHENYDYSGPSITNDIALIFLTKPLTFSDKVKPIALQSTTAPSGTMVDVTGYGNQEVEKAIFTLDSAKMRVLERCNTKSKLCRKLRRKARAALKKKNKVVHLKAVEVPIVSYEDCQKEYEDLQIVVGKDMICAGFKSGHKDACQGDSGGPVVSGGTLVAITDWGLGCGEEGLPGVYTNVAKHYDWIITTIQKHNAKTRSSKKRSRSG